MWLAGWWAGSIPKALMAHLPWEGRFSMLLMVPFGKSVVIFSRSHSLESRLTVCIELFAQHRKMY
jgi:hypothetical protein